MIKYKSQDKLKHGTNNKAKGAQHYKSKLSEAQVLEIRALDKYISKTEISTIYKISRGNIDTIINRRTWKHI